MVLNPLKIYLYLFIFLAGCHTLPVRNTVSHWHVLPVESVHRVQPSGLCMVSGELYAVSDKHDWIYKLKIQPTRVDMIPHLMIDKPALGVSELDLEGITSDLKGNFFLASERHSRLIRVNARNTSWVEGDVDQVARASGLLNKQNAGFEGVTFIPPKQFLIAVEREPRGLLLLTLNDQLNKVIEIVPQVMEETNFTIPAQRSADFSGLSFYNQKIYALTRNADLVNVLDKKIEGFTEGESWSYRDIVLMPENMYEDMRYGHAEGLVVNENYIYVLLDNNYSSKLNDPDDARPLLIVGQLK